MKPWSYNLILKDVARRLAKGDLIASRRDGAFPLGGYPGNDDEGRAMQKTLERQIKIEGDFMMRATLLEESLFRHRKGWAWWGFCFGWFLTNA